MDLPTKPLKVTATAKVPAARHALHRLAALVLTADAAGDVELMASEAITNAILHGLGGATVTVDCTEKAMRVEVRDDGPGFLVAGRVDHRRGLTLIDALADRWGLVIDETGTCLFFEVDREAGL